MICEKCDGRGFIAADRQYLRPIAPLMWPMTQPCPECDGCGIAHCCEGLREQPGEGE